MQDFCEKKMRAVFELGNIKVLNVWKLTNYYFENFDDPVAIDVCRRSPHWLVKTDKGLIRIGWRKRVLEIDWSDTLIKKIVTEDNVTKSEYLVHAYSITDAVKYLTCLSKELNKC